MPEKVYILYHKNCPDGLASAWVAWLKYGSEANYIPCAYQEPLPVIEDGSQVFFVDFSAPRSTLDALQQKCEVVVIDHHEKALGDLSGFANAIFDLNQCGATLAWRYWHGDKRMPAFLAYTRDRDLWLKQLPFTEEIFAATQEYPQTFESLSHWASMPDFITAMASLGATALAIKQQEVQELASIVSWAIIGGYEVPVAYAAKHGSDVAQVLYRRYPESPFVAVYYDDGNTTKWSLRSDSGKPDLERFNVYKIAEQYGGGGHFHASGFTCKIGLIPIH